MTKYRKVSNGYAYFLQHLRTRRFLFIKYKEWSYIAHPYHDTMFGRSCDTTGYDTSVCSVNNNLDDFVKKWTNISDYYKWANEEQEKLERKAVDENRMVSKKRKSIEYYSLQ